MLWPFINGSLHPGYHAFGWKSDKSIQRIKEALTEIKQVVKKESALAFLEKISPAFEQVASLSGAIDNHLKYTDNCIKLSNITIMAITWQT